MRKIFLSMVIFIILTQAPVYAADLEEITINRINSTEANALEITSEEIASKSGNSILEEFDFKENMVSALKGEGGLSVKEISNFLIKTIFNEVITYGGLIRRLIIIAILSAMLKHLASSFASKSVGETGFYVCYILLLMIVIETFAEAAHMVGSVVSDMTSYMQAALPFFTMLSFSSGGYVQTAAAPIILIISQIIPPVINTVFIPVISLSAVLELTSNISEENILSNMTGLIKSIVSWGLKGSALIIISVLSLQRLGLSGVNKVLGKTAKVAVNAIPVVGEIMTGAVETAAALSSALKGSAAFVAIIFIILICLLPMIKLGVMLIIYKVMAALMEPVCEPRLIKCINAAGDFSAELLAALFIAEIIFIFFIIMILAVV